MTYANRFAQPAAARNTSPAPAQAPAADAFDFEERTEPRFLQFGDGETVTGILASIERIAVKDKQVTRYTVQDLESGELVSFLGTYQIDTKIRRGDMGHVVDIRCEGSHPDVKRNGNAMKMFRVRVSKRTAPGWAQDGTQITDDDLPTM